MWRRQNCVEMLSSKDRVRNPIMKWIFHFFSHFNALFLVEMRINSFFLAYTKIFILKFTFHTSLRRWWKLFNFHTPTFSLARRSSMHSHINSQRYYYWIVISPCHSYRNLISTFSFCHSREWSSLPPTTRPPSPLSHSFGYLHSHSIDARADRTQFFFSRMFINLAEQIVWVFLCFVFEFTTDWTHSLSPFVRSENMSEKTYDISCVRLWGVVYFLARLKIGIPFYNLTLTRDTSREGERERGRADEPMKIGLVKLSSR